MFFGTIVCYVTHGHIQSQTVVMVKNDCVTDWRRVFIWLQFSVWMWSINGSTSLFMFRVLWWIKAETHLMHHADVSYTWNISSVILNRWCVRTSRRIMWGFVVLGGRMTSRKSPCAQKNLNGALGIYWRRDGILIYMFWHFASLLDRGNGARNEPASLMCSSVLQYSLSLR